VIASIKNSDANYPFNDEIHHMPIFNFTFENNQI